MFERPQGHWKADPAPNIELTRAARSDGGGWDRRCPSVAGGTWGLRLRSSAAMRELDSGGELLVLEA